MNTAAYQTTSREQPASNLRGSGTDGKQAPRAEALSPALRRALWAAFIGLVIVFVTIAIYGNS